MSAVIPFAAVRHWCLGAALPFWAEHGVDHDAGGFVEALDLAGARLDPGFKRMRVTARQIYCFAQGVELGFAPGLALVAHGMDFLSRAWQGPNAGWPRTVTRAGAPLDTAADLYDCAFVLFACAWAGRVLDRPEPSFWAGETLDFVTAHLAHPGGRGFVNASDAHGPRQQNPHMHLLEAALAAHETFGGSRFAALADDLVGLALDHFIDRPSGALREFFTQDWAPAPGPDGTRIEPGHCFEWAWILGEHMRLTDRDHRDAILRLVRYGEALGVDPATQVTCDAVDLLAGPLDRGSRTWPNTERIKGWLAAGRLGGPDPRPALAGSADVLLKRFLGVRPAGAWMDRFDAAGAPTATTIPASTFYHVLLAFAQLLGEEAALSAPG
jgi:mannose/cellobiose epimerase-like protein (N-acyl-D-glucosamine 2-epimerase family)